MRQSLCAIDLIGCRFTALQGGESATTSPCYVCHVYLLR